MDFELSEDQNLLISSFDSLLDRFRTPPEGEHGYLSYGAALQQEIADSGFLEIAKQDGFGPLEAALIVEAAARCPVSVEVAASALIAPLLGDVPAPLTIARSVGKPVRYLEQAQTVCVIEHDKVIVGAPRESDIAPIGSSVVAYPLAVLARLPDDAVAYTGDMARAIKRRALIGVAAEAVGLMGGALDLTVNFVKERHQFGRPLGSFQAIQHRLAEDAQLVHAARLMAFRAAYEDGDSYAAIACLYVQQAMRKIIYDCHQFSGAMGLTLEYPLHLWTYRLKYLQGELGGRGEQAKMVADTIWLGRSAA